MPTLTFAIGERVEPPMLEAIQSGLRQQLNGVHLRQSDIGTLYLVRLPPGYPSTSVNVELSALSARAISVDMTTDFHLTMPADALPAFGIPDDLLPYVSLCSVVSPHDGALIDRCAARLDELVGIPKDDVLDDIEARLRDGDWLSRWSRKHHGRVLPGIRDVTRSTSFVLLVGDPGTGKTVLVHQLPAVLSRRLGHPVLFIQLSQRLRGGGLQGQAGSDVVMAMEKIGQVAARHGGPTIVFLDDGEAVTARRSVQDGGSGANENVAVVDAMINGLDRIFASSEARLVFIMATNLLDRVDPAVIRRATRYTFYRPSVADRDSILRRCLGDILSDDEIRQIGVALERSGVALTAADLLTQVVTRAIREAAFRDEPITVRHVIELASSAVPT